jgi:hypothetical protein
MFVTTIGALRILRASIANVLTKISVPPPGPNILATSMVLEGNFSCPMRSVLGRRLAVKAKTPTVNSLVNCFLINFALLFFHPLPSEKTRNKRELGICALL